MSQSNVAITASGSNNNYVRKVAIVGAGGNIGGFFTRALLGTGKHEITAITRQDSTSSIPEGVQHVVRVDYNDTSAMTAALRGQDCLIITMSATAPPTQQSILIEAAAAAGVPYIFPNEYGADPTQVQFGKDIMLGPGREQVRQHVESLGKSKWIAFVNSFWYEYSLANAALYGFDIKNRAATLFDEGDVAINTTTWPQCGCAMAALLSLKVNPDNEHDKSACLSQFANKPVYISSFNISQNDMLDSILRVTGSSRADWKITNEPSKKRFEDGWAEFLGEKEFNMKKYMGFGKFLYSRSFYADLASNYEKRVGTHNELLGLPVESLDEATKVAIGMVR